MDKARAGVWASSLILQNSLDQVLTNNGNRDVTAPEAEVRAQSTCTVGLW